MSNKITWAELKEIVNKLPDNILRQPVTIWNSSEDAGSVAIGVKTLDEDYHFNGDEGCGPISLIKEHDDDFEENKDDYYLVHAVGTPIIIIPDEILV